MTAFNKSLGNLDILRQSLIDEEIKMKSGRQLEMNYGIKPTAKMLTIYAECIKNYYSYCKEDRAAAEIVAADKVCLYLYHLVEHYDENERPITVKFCNKLRTQFARVALAHTKIESV